MDHWEILLAVIAVLSAIYYYVSRGLDHFEKHGIPHEKAFPLVGNMGKTMLQKISVSEILKNVYRLSPEAKYVGFFDFGNPVIVLKDLELIKSITVKHFDNFPNHRAFIDPEVDPLFGKNLISLKDEVWKDWRNLLSPAFTSSKMRTMFKLMNNCAEDFAKFLKERAEEEMQVKKSSKGEAAGLLLDTKDCFTRYTNDVIATCAFGIGMNSMRNPRNEFYMTGKDVTNFEGVRTLKFFLLRLMPGLCKLLKLTFVGEKSANFFKAIIAQAIEAREEGRVSRPDMIQLMVDSKAKGKQLTLEDMTAQAMIFFFGGFDTTSTLMCFASYEIAVNPEVQEKLLEEIDKVLEETNGEPTYESINNMEYLGAVLDEALRMYPALVLNDRVANSSFELPPALPGLEPYHVKKGQALWIPSYELHHDPRYFEEPERFVPERFLGENKKRIEASTYLPFGLGPRMCIGNRFALLETRVLVFHLLAKCQLEPCEKTCVPIKFSKKGMIMRPEGGFWLGVKPRKNPWTSRNDKSNSEKLVDLFNLHVVHIIAYMLSRWPRPIRDFYQVSPLFARYCYTTVSSMDDEKSTERGNGQRSPSWRMQYILVESQRDQNFLPLVCCVESRIYIYNIFWEILVGERDRGKMVYWTILLAVISVILALVYYLRHDTRYFDDAGVPYKKPLLVIGSMWEMLLQRVSVSEITTALYEIDAKAKYVGSYDFFNPVVVLRDPELIKQITVKNFDSFTDHKSFVDEKCDPFFGKMLFALKGEKWREMRTLLSPSFTSSKMRAMFELMYKCSDNYSVTLAKMTKEREESVAAAGDGLTIDAKDVITRFTNDVIATCAFGIGLDSMKDRDNPFYLLGKDVSNFSGFAKMVKFMLLRNCPEISAMLGLSFISLKARNFFMGVIERSIRTRDQEGIARPDMLQLMMDTGRNRKDMDDLTIEDMTSQAFIFFLAGFDTTATVMAFALLVLAIHPEAQDKLVQEIDQIFEKSQGQPSYEDINNAEYLTAVINEILRLYPPQVIIDRVCVKDYELPACLPGSKPLKLKKDSYVWLPVYALHRDPAYFGENPNEFVPERFMKENKQKIELSCFMPFGVGPRMCIGNRFALLEIKVFIFHLLSRLRLEVSEKTVVPLVISRKSIAPQPEGGYWLKLVTRKSTPFDQFDKVQT
ncbi:uncharacterized protein [Prorops nasuta]|uniref:uncharacterized protein n=1 Tax=Prorops nasuta TaxID=863751 RepID=UPI0034CEF1C7